MKKILSLLMTILISLSLFACAPQSEGGSILDSDFKLVKQQTCPIDGTPNDYSPLENLAFAAYNFNNQPSWEATYVGEVVAAGVKQKVKNVRQYDGNSLFTQAISASSLKTVAEQKYFCGNKIFYRPYVKLNSADMTATWSNDASELSTEEYYKNYGLIPNEIFKFVIDESTVLSSEKIQSENYSYRFTLSTDCVKYFKNEVRTLAGSKSDPEYISVECTIETDENWNVIKTTSTEKYKVAILGGITCESVSEETFAFGGNVVIKEKAFFDAYVPTGDLVLTQPAQPYDYLLSAANTMLSKDLLKIKADVGQLSAIINYEPKTGLFVLKCGNVIVKSNGDHFIVSINGSNYTFDTLSLYEVIYFSFFHSRSESKQYTNVNYSSAVSTISSEADNDVLTKITDGMSAVLLDDGADITISFEAYGVSCNATVYIRNDDFDGVSGEISYNGNSYALNVDYTDETVIVNGESTDVNRVFDTFSRLLQADNVNFDVTLEAQNESLAANATFNTAENYAIIEVGDVRIEFTDAIYLITAHSCYKISYDALFAGKTDVSPATGIAGILLGSDVSFNDENSLTVCNEFYGVKFNITIRATDSIQIYGEIVYNDDIITFSAIEGSTLLIASGVVDGVLLDPILYFTYDALTKKCGYLLEASDSKTTLQANATTNFADSEYAVEIFDTRICANDAIYVDHPLGKLRFDYEALSSLAQIIRQTDSDLGTAALSSLFGGVKYLWQYTSLYQTNERLYVKVKTPNDFSLELAFDYATNYFGYALVDFGEYAVKITPQEYLVATPTDLSSFESANEKLSDLAKIAKELVSTKQFTLTFDDLLTSSGSVSGCVSFDLTADLILSANITFIADGEEHNLKAVLENGNVVAVYNDTLKATVSEETLVRIATTVLKIYGFDAERLLPQSVELDESEPIDDTISQLIQSLSSALPKNVSLLSIIKDATKQSQKDGAVMLTLCSGNLSSNISIPSDRNYSIKIENGFTAQTLPQCKYDYDFNSVYDLLNYAIATAKIEKYNIGGNLSLSALNLLDVNIPFTLKALPYGSNPLVYLKLEVPYVFGSLTKANSYVYYCNGIMYIKSDRYTKRLFQDKYDYDKTVYLSRTPQEFADNILEDIFVLIPMSDTIKALILKSATSGENGPADYANSLTGYKFENNNFFVTLNLKALTGNSNLGEMQLTLKADEQNGTFEQINASVKMLGSLISVDLVATLKDYDGIISFGENECDDVDIADLAQTITLLSNKHAQWQTTR